MSKSNLPKLDAPGAGLPWIQHAFLKYYVGPFVAAKSQPARNRQVFEQLNAKILNLMQTVPPDQWEQRILVPPQTGLEDSSRYWSLVMVLEHLTLVGEGMKAIILQLAQGTSPGLEISTARVKPKGETLASEVLARYRTFSLHCMVEIDPWTVKFQAEPKQNHPWLGPIGALQWHWLLASHTGLHYKQMKEIKKGLVNTLI